MKQKSERHGEENNKKKKKERTNKTKKNKSKNKTKKERKNKNKTIKYGEIFDSTKGYPREGPEKRRGKKQANCTTRGDQLWNDSLTMWNDQRTINIKKRGKTYNNRT